MSKTDEAGVWLCTGCGTEAVGVVPGDARTGLAGDTPTRCGLCPECNQKRVMELDCVVDEVDVGEEAVEVVGLDERAGTAVVSANTGVREVTMDEVSPA